MKKYIVSILAIFFGVLAFAETKKEGDYEISIKTTKSDAIYKQGEKATFVLKATKNGNPAAGLELKGEISKDSVAPRIPIEAKTDENGSFEISSTLNEPGFLKCKIFVSIPPSENQEEKKVDLLAGAAFDPFKIKPSLPAPKDFDKFWNEQKKILKKIPMNIVMTPVESEDPNIEVFDIQADTFNGKMSAYLAMPKGAKPKSLPAMVFPRGAGVYSSIIRYNWAKEGFITLDFNVHGLPNGKPRSYYEKAQSDGLWGYETRNSESRETIFFREAFMRLMRAMDVAMSLPQWDGKNLILTGGSQGGGQSIAGAALYNDKVSLVVATIPALCDHSGIVVGRTTGWPHFVKEKDANGNYSKERVEAARYVDCMNFASRIKCPAYFTINFADDVCEPTSSFAAYNNVKSKKDVLCEVEYRHMDWQPTTGKFVYEKIMESVKNNAAKK